MLCTANWMAAWSPTKGPVGVIVPPTRPSSGLIVTVKFVSPISGSLMVRWNGRAVWLSRIVEGLMIVVSVGGSLIEVMTTVVVLLSGELADDESVTVRVTEKLGVCPTGMRLGSGAN